VDFPARPGKVAAGRQCFAGRSPFSYRGAPPCRIRSWWCHTD
jgi:hypothetical protein